MTTHSLVAAVASQDVPLPTIIPFGSGKEPASEFVHRASDLARSDPAEADSFVAILLARRLLGAAASPPPGEPLGLSLAPSAVEADNAKGLVRQRYVLASSARRLVLIPPTPAGAPAVPVALLRTDDPRLVLVPDAPSFAASAIARGWVESSATLDGRDVRRVARADVDALRLLAELLRGAVEHGIVSAFLTKARNHLKTRSHPWPDTGVERASEDPHLVRRYGEYVAAFDALTELLEEGARTTEQAIAGSVALDQAWPDVAAARLFAIRTGKEIINGTIELLGASSVSVRYGFDAFWRDFTHHATSEPPQWPVEALGEATLLRADGSHSSTEVRARR